MPVLLILISIVSISCVSKAESVRITTGEWAPFISEKYRHGGVLLHIVEEAFKRKGLEVEFGFFPWARAVAYVDQGAWDAMAVTGSRVNEKGINHLYSDPIYIGLDVLFHRRSTPFQWQTFEDLHGLTFGAALSYKYSDDYRQALKLNQIKQVIAPSPELLFPMLAAKRFDIFIMDKRAGVFTYNTQFRQKLGDPITYHEKPLLSLPYAVRFSGDAERSQRLQALFNTSLKEMRAAGIVDQYYADFEAGLYQPEEVSNKVNAASTQE